MEFKIEIDAATRLGLEGFQQYMEKKLRFDKSYLERPIWTEGGAQITILNYLIQEHQEKRREQKEEVPGGGLLDLTPFIHFVLSKIKDKNNGEPLHQALAAGKIKLGNSLLDTHVFDVNRRDEEGRTLLSLVLATKNRPLLQNILKSKPDVNAITRMAGTRIPFQPLHQAIMLDFAAGVTILGEAGADLSNPWGEMKDTPLLLAARLGKIKALEALLEFPVEKSNLEAENIKLASDNKKKSENAVESLCRLLAQDLNNKELIRGVAMLFCQGATPPRNASMCQLLVNKRSDLIKEIDRYMDSRPHLVDAFVTRCHLAGGPLHQIIYGNQKSWGSALRQLVGLPSATAFIIERLITRKYSRPLELEGCAENQALLTAAAEPLKGDEPPFKLYAEFVRRYNEAYRNQRMTNPWSTMRWMIVSGKCDWETVEQYARTHPGTRTQIIYDEMFQDAPKMVMNEEIGSPAEIHSNYS